MGNETTTYFIYIYIYFIRGTNVYQVYIYLLATDQFYGSTAIVIYRQQAMMFFGAGLKWVEVLEA